MSDRVSLSKLFVAINLVLLLSIPYGAHSVSALSHSPNSRLKCTRTTWANTDKCKDPAVASKKAPKDLKKEIERLASLTATSYSQLKTEQIALDKIYQKELAKWRIEDEKHKKEQLVVQEACFKSLGMKFNPSNYSYNWPAKCMALHKFSPSQPYRAIGGASRKVWAQAWLDLTTIAKTFPQHIQPDKLSLLINNYEIAKACVPNPQCLPVGL